MLATRRSGALAVGAPDRDPPRRRSRTSATTDVLQRDADLDRGELEVLEDLRALERRLRMAPEKPLRDLARVEAEVLENPTLRTPVARRRMRELRRP
jgi:hypothetical protein